ncbi:MAG: hypothetical protein ABIL58_16495 [Pseudomonadota bacterium]
MPTRQETFHFKKRMAVLKEAISRALSARGKFSDGDVDALVDAVMLAGSFKHSDKSPLQHQFMKKAADNLVEVCFTRQEAEALLKITGQNELKGIAKRAAGRIKEALPETETASKISASPKKGTSD